MPELPEVERARRLLARTCEGKVIDKVTAIEQGGAARDGQFDDIIFEGLTPTLLESSLRGRKILKAQRKGKHLWLDLEGDGFHPIFHFGMSGNFVVRNEDSPGYRRKVGLGKEGEWPPRFCKLELVLEDDTAVAFTCPRRIGRVRLVKDVLGSPPISELGFDPLNSMPAVEDFVLRLQKNKCAVKALLLDQGFSAGVGNWIADEVCFQAKLHPARVASALSDEEGQELWRTLSRVIEFACDVNADHTKFPPDWLFHYRWTKGSKDAVYAPSKEKLQFLTVGGRTTAIVPSIQRNIGIKKKKKSKETAKTERRKKKTGLDAVGASTKAKRLQGPVKGRRVKGIGRASEPLDTAAEITPKKRKVAKGRSVEVTPPSRKRRRTAGVQDVALLAVTTSAPTHPSTEDDIKQEAPLAMAATTTKQAPNKRESRAASKTPALKAQAQEQQEKTTKPRSQAVQGQQRIAPRRSLRLSHQGMSLASKG